MRCGAEHSVHYRRKLNMRYRQIAACPMRLYALTSLDSERQVIGFLPLPTSAADLVYRAVDMRCNSHIRFHRSSSR